VRAFAQFVRASSTTGPFPLIHSAAEHGVTRVKPLAISVVLFE
jgi:hypothetical protein